MPVASTATTAPTKGTGKKKGEKKKDQIFVSLSLSTRVRFSRVPRHLHRVEGGCCTHTHLSKETIFGERRGFVVRPWRASLSAHLWHRQLLPRGFRSRGLLNSNPFALRIGSTPLTDGCDIVIEKMVALVSRQGRQHQRYSKDTGGRLVVGCIPYKWKGQRNGDNCGIEQSMEVLVVSSQKGNAILFPKGGWENDETMEEAARREALEEAGVQGTIGRKLGEWKYRSRSHDAVYQGIMFPLHVKDEEDELVDWPERSTRKRQWVSVAEFMEGCPHSWMREALEQLVKRLSPLPTSTQHKNNSYLQMMTIVANHFRLGYEF